MAEKTILSSKRDKQRMRMKCRVEAGPDPHSLERGFMWLTFLATGNKVLLKVKHLP